MDTGGLDVVKLVDFESMVTAVLGTSLSELGSILDMLAPAKTDGTVASVLLHVQNTMQEEGIAAMAPVVLDVVSDNAFVQTMLVQAVQPVLYFLGAIILLLMALLWVRCYRRHS